MQIKKQLKKDLKKDLYKFMIALIHGSTCGATYSFLRKSHPNGCFDGFDNLVAGGEAKLFWWAKSTDKLSFWEVINLFKVFQTYQTDKKYVRTLDAQIKLGEFLRINKPKIIIAHSVGCEYLLEYLANYQTKNQSDNENLVELKRELELKDKSEIQNQKQISGKIKKQNNLENEFENGLENLEFIYLLQSDCVAKNLDLTKFINRFKKNYTKNRKDIVKESLKKYLENHNSENHKKVQIYNYFCPFDTALISSLATNWRIPDGLFGSQSLVLQNRFVFLNDLSNLHATMPKSTQFADEILKKRKNLDKDKITKIN